jgi:hypothetical protein
MLANPQLLMQNHAHLTVGGGRVPSSERITPSVFSDREGHQPRRPLDRYRRSKLGNAKTIFPLLGKSSPGGFRMHDLSSRPNSTLIGRESGPLWRRSAFRSATSGWRNFALRGCMAPYRTGNRTLYIVVVSSRHATDWARIRLETPESG